MDTNQCIFKNDPIYMKSLIGKLVEITTVDGTVYKGAVYVIDPESKTVVLTNPHLNTTNFNIDLILHDSIQSFLTLDDVNPSFLLENKDSAYKNVEDLQQKKTRLMQWLKENLVNVHDADDELKLGDAVTIEYPYGPEQCFCDNTIVLERIRTLIQKMPANYMNEINST